METVILALSALVVGFALGRVKSLAIFQKKKPTTVEAAPAIR
jgi:hypothetical protein